MRVNTFIAYVFSKGAIETIVAVQDRFRELINKSYGIPAESLIRTIAPDKLHMTLVFLGALRPDISTSTSVPTSAAASNRASTRNEIPIKALLSQLELPKAEGPGQLELSRFGAFPTVRRPRVIWLGVEDRSRRTEGIVSALRDQLHRFSSFAIDHRPFVPHITIAYPRRRLSGKQRQQLGRVLDEANVRASHIFEDKDRSLRTITATKLALIQSIPTPDGTRYKEIDAVWL